MWFKSVLGLAVFALVLDSVRKNQDLIDIIVTNQRLRSSFNAIGDVFGLVFDTVGIKK